MQRQCQVEVEPPLAFTEHGAIMVATLLSSARAVEVSIYVVRAFIQFRTGLSSDTELSRQLTKLERHLGSHDTFIVGMLKTIRELRNAPDAPSIDFGDTED